MELTTAINSVLEYKTDGTGYSYLSIANQSKIGVNKDIRHTVDVKGNPIEKVT